ncbi:hypothetical protein [Cryptosporangium minutisporangium]|uniref:Acyltransferase n=1 Tax=Cryptosporangium minutisporangium TaxID=113569 RepID=A0ABP6T4U4_9ACTN
MGIGVLGVAVVVARIETRPDGLTARTLALPPLVGIGRISYGLYLWHWPTFLLLDADRTGLSGGALLGVRCAATAALALASYTLVEQPIRTGRWPVRYRPAFATALDSPQRCVGDSARFGGVRRRAHISDTR